MERNVLSNPPIVEVIFELRWKLLELAPMMMVDPSYKVAVGRLYDKLIEQNGHITYEPLKTANMPDEISGYVIQYRFHETKYGWPLV